MEIVGLLKKKMKNYDHDDDDTDNREIVCERIALWSIEGTYNVFRHMYG